MSDPAKGRRERERQLNSGLQISNNDSLCSCNNAVGQIIGDFVQRDEMVNIHSV
jgi:hypothetical protein